MQSTDCKPKVTVVSLLLALELSAEEREAKTERLSSSRSWNAQLKPRNTLTGAQSRQDATRLLGHSRLLTKERKTKLTGSLNPLMVLT